MNKRMVVVFVMMAIGLILPCPRSAQDKSANSIQKDGNDKNANPNSVVLSQAQLAPQKNQNPSAEVAPKDIEHSVSIERPVPVNSIKDPWDKSLVILTGCLVIAGFFQLWFFWQTVKATSANVKALIESQRAQVAFQAVGNPSQELLDKEVPRVRIALINKGMTTAYDVVYESWMEILVFPFNDFTSAADYFKSTDASALCPNHTPLTINIPFRKRLTADQRADLMGLRKYACIRVRVSYRDAFKALRYANFGIYVMREGFGILPRYNDAN
jgi:hypothetical protein